MIDQAMVAIAQTTAKVTRMVNDLLTSLKRLHEALQQYKLMISALRVALSTRAGEYAHEAPQ